MKIIYLPEMYFDIFVIWKEVLSQVKDSKSWFLQPFMAMRNYLN